MNVRPNETRVKATVMQVTPCADGHGYDVELEIEENRSPDPANDFLQPQLKDKLQVFSANLGELIKGQQIQATLTLSGGPFQQRPILRKSEPIKH